MWHLCISCPWVSRHITVHSGFPSRSWCSLSALPTPRSVPLPVSSPDDPVWYAHGLAFECTQCGNCCSGAPGYVWLTVDNMRRTAAYLRMSFDEFTGTYVRTIGPRYALTEKFNYDCSFLTRDGKGKVGCMIYPVRPMQCRTWPFWNENLKSPAAWKGAGAKCPGIRAAGAARHEVAHIEQCRQHPENPA